MTSDKKYRTNSLVLIGLRGRVSMSATALLNVPSGVAQRFKALGKQCRASVRQAINRKPIGVLFVAAMVSAPCLAETPAVNGAEKLTVFQGDSALSGVSMGESVVQHVPTKPGERLRIDGGVEGIGGANQMLVAVSPEGKAMGDQQRKADAGETKQPQVRLTQYDSENIHPLLWIFLGFIWGGILLRAPPEGRDSKSIQAEVDEEIRQLEAYYRKPIEERSQGAPHSRYLT